jgi:ATP-dependent Clp protease adapter protein ClpS
MSTAILEEKKTIDNGYYWKVIMFNNSYNSFDYVIKMLVRCLNISVNDAMEKAVLIDKEGLAIVYEGPQEPAEDAYEILCNYPAEERDGKIFPKINLELTN